MGRIILEHIDYVVQANEWVIDGNNIHFARVEVSPGDQICSLLPSPLCLRDEGGTAQEDVTISGRQKNREPFSFFS